MEIETWPTVPLGCMLILLTWAHTCKQDKFSWAERGHLRCPAGHKDACVLSKVWNISLSMCFQPQRSDFRHASVIWHAILRLSNMWLGYMVSVIIMPTWGVSAPVFPPVMLPSALWRSFFHVFSGLHGSIVSPGEYSKWAFREQDPAVPEKRNVKIHHDFMKKGSQAERWWRRWKSGCEFLLGCNLTCDLDLIIDLYTCYLGAKDDI